MDADAHGQPKPNFFIDSVVSDNSGKDGSTIAQRPLAGVPLGG
jgi:hypothetical protein